MDQLPVYEDEFNTFNYFVARGPGDMKFND